MDASRPISRNSLAPAAAAAAFVAASLVFCCTAYPTITWWESSGYSLAAATLGVYSPPGSLLLTLLGWPVAHIASGAAAARALNLFAAILAGTTVALVAGTGATLLRVSGEGRTTNLTAAAVIGAALGALSLGFSDTLWTYATEFTPYILTSVFTALILLVLVRWWEDADDLNAWRWAGWLGLLFGVDFSVHRTNALLIPGALVWIAIRRPRTLTDRRVIVAGIGLFVAGLALQLLLIPIAARGRSPLDFNSPSSLSMLWDYITLKQLGGSFLLQLFPRKSPIWSSQSADLLRTLRDDFARWRWGIGLGALPALAAFGGLVVIWRRRPRLGMAALALLVLQASLTVLYFNIPANYFRTLDRHYLPVVVTIGLLAACGAGAAAEGAVRGWRSSRRVPAAVLAAFVVLVPAAQLVMNWRSHDSSRRYFTHDYANNVLAQLPPNAIYFTVGDNDTFPIMYLQAVEGIRPDVTNINLSIANVPDWPERLRRRDPSLRLSLDAAERRTLVAAPWIDSLVTLPVSGRPADFGLSPATVLPASIALHVKPVSGSHMIPAEVLLLDIVRTNGWRRPLTFATTGTKSAMEWLAPYSRLDGLYFRIVPTENVPADAALLRENVIARPNYRGYADPRMSLDGVSRTLGMQSYGGLIALLDADRAAGPLDQCRRDRAALLAQLPLDRLQPPPEIADPIQSSCGSESSAK
jgi:transmembrane protein TMEM260 (protein O-mannosyltransferase)